MLSKSSILPIALLTLGCSGLASARTYDEGQRVTTFMAGGDFIPQGSFNPHVARNIGDLNSIDPSCRPSPGSRASTICSFATHSAPVLRTASRPAT